MVTELDRGWVAGAMCNNLGKCLVGAGAAVLGWQYLPEEQREAFFGQRDYNDPEVRSYITAQEAKESEAGLRLYGLLGSEVDPYGDYPIDCPDLATDMVINFNDGFSDYSELRPVLVGKLEELRSAE